MRVLIPQDDGVSMKNRMIYPAVCGALLALALAAPILGQWSTGSLVGRVVDTSSLPIAGARVILLPSDSSRATHEAESDVRGRFAIPGLPPGVYLLQVRFTGFLPAADPSLTIVAGQPTAVQVQMSQIPGETVTVTADPPSSAGTTPASMPTLTVRRDELEGAAQARDPWTLASRAPGVLTLGLNHGGSSAGQQFFVLGGGAAASETAYEVDGVRVTDMLATGASQVYFDFDQYDEVAIATGAFDLSSPNAGVSMQLKTRRSGRAWRGSGRFLFTDQALAAEGDSRQKALSARVDSISEFGLEFGGPLWREVVGLWASAGRSSIDRLTAAQQPAEIRLDALAAKLDGSVGHTSYSLLAQRSEKLFLGRGLSAERAPETAWDQSGPFDLVKLASETMLDDRWLVDASASGTDGLFLLEPRGRDDIVVGADGVWRGGYVTSIREPSSEQAQLEVLGALRTGRWAHSPRLGMQWRRQRDSLFEFWGERGTITYARGLFATEGAVLEAIQSAPQSLTERYGAAWIGDTLQTDRLSLQIGLRYDQQEGATSGVEVPAHRLLPELLPAYAFAGRDYGFEWRTLAPRAAMSLRLDAEGKSLLRAGLARFPSQLSGTVGLWQMNGAVRSGLVVFDDQNDNFRLDAAEPILTQWVELGASAGRVDPQLSPEFYDTASLGVDRDLGPLRLSLDATFRRQSRVLEERQLIAPAGGDRTATRLATREDYVPAGSVAGHLPDGRPYDVPVYQLADGWNRVGTLLVNGDRRRDYRALTLGLERPWLGVWSLRSHLTLSDWTWHLGPEFRRFDDPTDESFGVMNPFATDPADDDGETAGVFGGGAGSGYLGSSRWSYSVVGRVALAHGRPWSFDLALNVAGRDGYPLAYTRRVPLADGTTFVAISPRADSYRTDPVHLLDLRLEKTVRLGGVSATFGLDAFNLLGSQATLAAIRIAGPKLGQPTEVVGPRIIRVGLRLRFDR